MPDKWLTIHTFDVPNVVLAGHLVVLYNNMIITLENMASFSIRLLQPGDADGLFHYFTSLLSAESKSRYAPHLFDRAMVENICANLPGDTLRYVAIDQESNIAAYMLVKKGMVDGDRTRLLMKGIYFDQDKICTFAPSVADSWQNAGLGSRMYDFIEREIMEATPYRHIVLWGGVQATNFRAVHFYEKKGFEHQGMYTYNGIDNYDMTKLIPNS